MKIYKISLKFIKEEIENKKVKIYFTDKTINCEYQFKYFCLKNLYLLKNYEKYNFFHNNDIKDNIKLIDILKEKNIKYKEHKKLILGGLNLDLLYYKENILIGLKIFNETNSIYYKFLNYLHKEEKIKKNLEENGLLKIIQKNIENPSSIFTIYLLQYTLTYLENENFDENNKNKYYFSLIEMYLNTIFKNGLFVEKNNKIIIKQLFILLDLFLDFKIYFNKFNLDELENKRLKIIYNIIKKINLTDGDIYKYIYELEEFCSDKNEHNMQLFWGDFLSNNLYGIEYLDKKHRIRLYNNSIVGNKFSYLKLCFFLNQDFVLNNITKNLKHKKIYNNLLKNTRKINDYDFLFIIEFNFRHNFYMNHLKLKDINSVYKEEEFDYNYYLKESLYYLQQIVFIGKKEYYELFIGINLFLKIDEKIIIMEKLKILDKLFFNNNNNYYYFSIKLKFINLKLENDNLNIFNILDECLDLMKEFEKTDKLLFVNLCFLFSNKIKKIGLDYISNKLYEICFKILINLKEINLKKKLYYICTILLKTQSKINKNYDISYKLLTKLINLNIINYEDNFINYKVFKILNKNYKEKINKNFYFKYLSNNTMNFEIKKENNDLLIKELEKELWILEKEILLENFHEKEDLSLRDIDFSSFNFYKNKLKSKTKFKKTLVLSFNNNNIKRNYDFKSFEKLKNKYNLDFIKKIKNITKVFEKNEYEINNKEKYFKGIILSNKQKIRIKRYNFEFNDNQKLEKSNKLLNNIITNLEYFTTFNPFFLNILGIYYEEIIDKDKDIYIDIIYEYFEYKLFDFIFKNKLLVEEKFKIIYYLTNAVNSLHQINLTHKNLFNEYISINDNLNIKILIPLEKIKIKKKLLKKLFQNKDSSIPSFIYNIGLDEFENELKKKKNNYYKFLDLHFLSYFIIIILLNEENLENLRQIENWKNIITKEFKKIKLINELKELFKNFFYKIFTDKQNCSDLILEIEKYIIIYYNDIKIISKNNMFQKMFNNFYLENINNYNDRTLFLPKNHKFIGNLNKINNYPIGEGKLYYKEKYIMKVLFSDDNNFVYMIYLFNNSVINFDNLINKLNFKLYINSKNTYDYAILNKIFFFKSDKTLKYLEILKKNYIRINNLNENKNKNKNEKIKKKNEKFNFKLIKNSINNLQKELDNNYNSIKTVIDLFGNYIYITNNEEKTKNEKTKVIIYGSIEPNNFFQTKILINNLLLINNLWNYSIINIKSTFNNFNKINLKTNLLNFKKIFMIDYSEFIFYGKLQNSKTIKGIFLKNRKEIYDFQKGKFPKNYGKLLNEKNELKYWGEFNGFEKNGFGYIYYKNHKYIYGFFNKNSLEGKAVIYNKEINIEYKVLFQNNIIKYVEFFNKSNHLISIKLNNKIKNIFKLNHKDFKDFNGFLYSELYEKKNIKNINLNFEEPYQIKLDNGDTLLGNITKKLNFRKLPIGYCVLTKKNKKIIYLGNFNGDGMKGKKIYKEVNKKNIEYIKSNFIYDDNFKLIVNGYTIIKYKNGNEFLGVLEKDNFNGYGKFYNKSEKITLIGFFINNKLNHYAKEIKEEDYEFEGYFKDNIKNGIGILKMKNELIYGYWENNILKYIYEKNPNIKLNDLSFKYIISGVIYNDFSDKWFKYGYCIIENNKKNYKYIGEIKNNKIIGIGKLKSEKEIYKGEFKNGFYGNIGYYKNEEITYYGEFYKSKKNGKGILINENNIFEGIFLKNFKDGFFIISNILLKSKEFGNFKKNLKVGKFLLKSENKRFLKFYEYDNLLKIIKLI